MKLLEKNILAGIEVQKKMLADDGLMSVFSQAAEHVVSCYQKGGRLYIAGNGGSAADSQHLAAEFVSKLARDRNPLPAEALTTDSSILTAIGNDYGFEHIFSRQLTGKLRANDVFLGITTSGHSLNILRALQECKAKGIKTIVFTGRNGGLAKGLADYCLIVPGEMTSSIQELHILLAHTLCESVESELFPIQYT